MTLFNLLLAPLFRAENSLPQLTSSKKPKNMHIHNGKPLVYNQNITILLGDIQEK